MNAPRQGLFATFLLLAFILEMSIILFSAYHEQTVVREEQGNLLVNQLVLDALPGVLGRDSVALALIADRYTNRPDIAELKIYDLQKNLLATNGQAPSRAGEIFEKDVLVDQKPIGRVQLRMVVPYIGEILQQKAPVMIASAFIFSGLWFLYRGTARPYQNARNNLPSITEPLEHKPVSPEQLATVEEKTITGMEANKAIEAYNALMRVDILDTRKYSELLGISLAQPLMDMGQTFLERSVNAVRILDPDLQVQWLKNFSTDGGLLSFKSATPEKTIESATLIAAVFQESMDTFYHIQRQNQQFSFKTKILITDLSQFEKASSIIKQLSHNEVNAKIQLAINDSNIRSIMNHFSLSPLHTSQNAITRPLGLERFHLLGFHAKKAEQVIQLRDEVLSAC